MHPVLVIRAFPPSIDWVFYLIFLFAESHDSAFKDRTGAIGDFPTKAWLLYFVLRIPTRIDHWIGGLGHTNGRLWEG